MHRSSRAASSRLHVTFLRAAATAVLVLGCSAPAKPEAALPALQFDRSGGEAWTFGAELTGTAPEACTSVALERGADRVQAKVEDGRFRAVVPLAPGVNVVEASCPAAQSARTELHVRLPATPRAALRVDSVEDTILVDGHGSAPNRGTEAPLTRFEWSVDPHNPAPLITADGTPLDELEGPEALLATPTRDGTYRLWLTVVDDDARRDRAGLTLLVENGRARSLDRTDEPPTWADEAVVYGVVPFLFGDPAIDAVTERLPKLAELGVTTLWLSPIFEGPDGDFGYAVNDYFAVRAEWGDLERFRALVDRAHALGLKVVLDFVPNHTSVEHRYFIHAKEHGIRSRYWDFYDRDASGDATHYFDWDHLPNLDYDNPEVRRWMIEAFAFWTRELDVDGFRVDVAWGVIERDPTFFEALREELVRIDPDVLLLAEASARDPRSFEGFDAAYDWTAEVGRWSWGEVFDGGDVDVPALKRALHDTPERVFRFLDNNDTGARFVTRHGPLLERVASALLFTLPGLPGLFTGQELGVEYEPYQQVEPLAFPEDPERFAHYRELAQLRRSEAALQTGRFVPLETDGDVYAFARIADEGGARPVVVVLGFGDAPTVARLRLPHDVAAALRGRRPEPLLGAGDAPRLGAHELRVHLAPHDARVWAFD